MFEIDLEAYCLFIDVVLQLHRCELFLVIKMVIFLIVRLSMSFALHLRHGCDKSYVIRGCTISMVVSRITMDLYFERRIALRWLLLSRVISHAAMDAWTAMSRMGPRLRDNECLSLEHSYITILDIAFYGVAHFITDELKLVFCCSCECFSVKLVTVEV